MVLGLSLSDVFFFFFSSLLGGFYDTFLGIFYDSLVCSRFSDLRSNVSKRPWISTDFSRLCGASPSLPFPSRPGAYRLPDGSEMPMDATSQAAALGTGGFR